MNDTDTTLIEILATSDALFRALRAADWAGSTPGVISCGRRDYLTAGVPWNVGGRATARSQAERALDALAASDLLILCGRLKRTGIRLSESGEHLARALCGLPSVVDSWTLLREVIDLAVKHGDHGPLCRELWLCRPPLADYGVPSYQKKLAEVQDRASPALLRNWLDSRSDIFGRVYYVPTSLGRTIASGDLPTLPKGLPRKQRAAFDLYAESVLAARAKLRSTEPDDRSEIGALPLPVSIVLRRRTSRQKGMEAPVDV